RDERRHRRVGERLALAEAHAAFLRELQGGLSAGDQWPALVAHADLDAALEWCERPHRRAAQPRGGDARSQAAEAGFTAALRLSGRDGGTRDGVSGLALGRGDERTPATAQSGQGPSRRSVTTRIAA